MRHLIVALTSFCLLFGYLSYSFYSSKEKAESALKGALEANSSLENSLAKKEQECRIADSLSAEWQREKDASDKQKDSDIQRIDKLPAKKSSEVKPNENNDVVDIDGKLPDDLRLLLQQSYNRDKGSASDDS